MEENQKENNENESNIKKEEIVRPSHLEWVNLFFHLVATQAPFSLYNRLYQQTTDNTAKNIKKEEITHIIPSNRENSQFLSSNNFSLSSQNFEKSFRPESISYLEKETTKTDTNQEESHMKGFVPCKKKLCPPPEIIPEKIDEIASELSRSSIKIKKLDKTDISSKRNKKSATTTYPSKNILKILGNTVITKILRKDFRDKSVIPKSLLQKKGNLNYPQQWEDQASLHDFQEWIKEKNFMVVYGNIYVFKEIWSFNCDPKLNWRETHFRWVLRNITLYFLENESYENIIFEKNIKKGSAYIIEYLKKIPRLLHGIDLPDNFNSLGGGIKKFVVE